jgi:hypothetical protein
MSIVCHRGPSFLGLLLSAALLNACAEMGGNQLPSTQPVSSLKLAALRPGMTYAQFEVIFGLGWLSPSSPTREKYWFLDDSRIVAVAPTVWQSPGHPLVYRIIGHAPVSQRTPILLTTPDVLLPQKPTPR